MRPEVRAHLEASYPRRTFSQLDDDVHDVVLRLYGYGSRFREGAFPTVSGPGQRVWDDAEQFLDYLDTAVAGGPGSPAFQRIDEIVGGHISLAHAPSKHNGVSGVLRLSNAAKRLIAGVCSAFLVRADPSTERWEPFKNWAQRLTPKDTIITFNYDCVLELLNRVTNTISVVRLGEPKRAYNGARLLKLHGSVNWKITGWQPNAAGLPTGTEKIDAEPQDDLDFALKCADHELAIASPGPLKKAISAGWLAELWRLAVEAIMDADAITFIGYRFPETDSYALKRLLNAIAGNNSTYLALHTVLGLNSPDMPRLSALLRFSLPFREPHPPNKRPELNTSTKTFTLLNHPLYGQDFLSVYPDSWITNAWRVLTA